MINQKRRNHGDYPDILQHLQLSQIFVEKNSCCVFGGISLVSCIMSCSNRTKQFGAVYRTPLMRLCQAFQKKRAHYSSRHDKVILLRDNVRPHVTLPVKTYLETLEWEVLPDPPYSPDIAPSDVHLFRLMTHGLSEQHFKSYENTKNWVDSWIASKDEAFF